jgi:hypothetical protein
MKTGFLLTVSLAALVGSIALARADEIDNYALGAAALEAQVPSDALTPGMKDSIGTINQSIQDIKTLKGQATDAQNALNKAVSDLPDVPTVAAAQATLTALKAAFDGMPSAKAALDKAVANLNEAKYRIGLAQASVNLANLGQAAFNSAASDPNNKDHAAAAGYTDYAKFKADAAAGLANAISKGPDLEYAALVAADNVKDPKNGLTKLQGAVSTVQAAQAKAQGIADATAKLNLANANVAAKVKSATDFAATTITVVNAAVLNYQNKTTAAPAKPAPALATGTATPSLANGTGAPGLATGTGTPSLTGTGVMSNASGGIVGQNNAGIVGQNNAGIVGQNNAGIVGDKSGASGGLSGSAPVISNDGGSKPVASLISQDGTTLASKGTTSLISQDSTTLLGNEGSNLKATNSNGGGAGVTLGPIGSGTTLLGQEGSNVAMLAMAGSGLASNSSGAAVAGSVITANSNFDTPQQALALSARNNLSSTDRAEFQTLVDIVAKGGKLTGTQPAEADRLLKQVLRGVSQGTQTQLQQMAAAKSGTQGNPVAPIASATPATAAPAAGTATPAKGTSPTSGVAVAVASVANNSGLTPAPVASPAPTAGTTTIDPAQRALAAEPGLYEKIVAMKLPADVMKQIGTGTFGTGPVAAEISKALIAARTELAAAKSGSSAPGTPVAPIAAPAAAGTTKPEPYSPAQLAQLQGNLEFAKKELPVIQAQLDANIARLKDPTLSQQNRQALTASVEASRSAVVYYNQNIKDLTVATGQPVLPANGAPGTLVAPIVVATKTTDGNPVRQETPNVVAAPGISKQVLDPNALAGAPQPLKLDSKLVANIQKELVRVPGEQNPDQNHTLSELDRLLKLAAKGPLVGKDATDLTEFAVKFAKMHPAAERKYEFSKIVNAAAPKNIPEGSGKTPAVAAIPAASPGGNAAPGSKETPTLHESAVGEREGVAKKADYMRPQDKIMPSPEKEKAIDAKGAPTATEPTHEKKSAAVEPAHSLPKQQPATKSGGATNPSAPKMVAPVTAQKSATMAPPANKPPPAPPAPMPMPQTRH